MTDKQIAFILSNIYRTNLTRKGKILWTNINVDNPYRCWIEYLGDWTLIERSQEYCRDLCVEASIPNEKIGISLEETGLTNIIEIQR